MTALQQTHTGLPTAQRSTTRELLDIALPMVVSQGSFAIMVFCDRMFLSFLGPEYIAAAMAGGVSAFFTCALFTGTLSYANALTAQYYGRGDHKKCPRVVTHGALLSVAALPVVVLAAVGVYWLFSKVGHAEYQLALERSYYRVLIAGAIFLLLKTVVGSYFAGIGRTRVVMIADVAGVALNIPLSYVLIFGKLGLPAMGITGAAWGTVISGAFSLGIFLLFFFGRQHRQQFAVSEAFQLDRGLTGRYLRLGIPSGFEMFMNVGTFNLFVLMFQSYGVAAGAAAAIVFNWDMMSFVPMVGLHIAVISLIGRYVGANDMSQTNAVILAGFKLACGYAGTLGLVFVVFRSPLVGLFAQSDADFSEILELGSFMMVGLACYVLADATVLVAGGTLRGAGDTRWLMTVSIALHCLMVFAQYLIIMVYDLGPRTSWIAFVAMIILLALAFLGRLLGGVWRQPERLARVMAE
ncbi:MAG: MATE family efflux transporter [Pseudomonadota bacterium]